MPVLTPSKLFSLDEIVRLAEELVLDDEVIECRGAANLCGCPLHRIIDHAKAVMA